MCLIFLCQIIFKNQKIRQRYCKEIILHLIVQMPFSVILQFIQAGMTTFHLIQRLARQCLVQYHICRLIIVIHCAHRFIVPNLCQFKILLRLILSIQMFLHYAKFIVNIIILGTFQTSFTQILRLLQCLLQ